MSNVACVTDLLTFETSDSRQSTQEEVLLDFPQSIEAQAGVVLPVSRPRFLQYLF